ncbi:MAG: hypothetical protein QOH49_3404 [Acidobacteriota bacterium]|nr:hypothetical protein [Acidobacteriota bacterium]
MSTEQQAAPTKGLMDFYDNYQAPLRAGSYRLVLQQTVSLEGGEEHHYYRDQPFEVLAPRYTIEGSEIQAYFPPPGGVADYQNALPHLVLRTRNLPWERSVWPGEGREPWFVLLVLSEQDILEGRAAVKTGTVADLAPTDNAAAVWSRVEAGATVMLPKFAREGEDAETPVRLLDLDLDLFIKLCPRREELPLLAHIRRVDTADKVPLEMVADGEFAVLVANRFPQMGANTIHLISLEGWDTLLDTPATQTHAATRLRLVTLGSWSFVSAPAGQDTFGGLMQRLRKNVAVFNVTPPAQGGEQDVNGALARGYVPIDYRPLESTPTFAWYRGPLSPVVRAPLDWPPFRSADSALVFDESTALFDVSYAAAWQLGRLLALASPAFTKGLRLFVERQHNATEFARQVNNFLALHRSAFTELKSKPPQPGDERITIADELVEWLARAVLLYPVPFQYLVPHPSLLPQESLRFFHLDDNWVDSLVDGALSVAVRGHADEGLAARADMQSALSKIVYQHRLRLLGKDPEWNPSERYMDVPKSGFLLRSSIVTDWPGVEVIATTDAPRAANLPDILRLEQIADGVLFCLARGSIKAVTFREPREGLTFGVDTDGNLQAHTSGTKFNVRPGLMRADSRPGVADVAALRGRLAESEKRNVGPAEFALQMIHMPEEQVIKWG